MQGANTLLYHCAVIKDDKLIVLQGLAKKDIDSNLQEFKKLVRTVEIK